MLSRPKIRTTWFRNRPAALLVAGVAVLGLVAGAVVLFVVPDGSTDGSTGGPAPEAAAKPWRLVWSDEFDRPELDRTKWNAEDDSTYGDGGKTVSCLMDRPENLALEKGRLVLSAARESTPLNCGGNDRRFPQGRSYSSAHLTTKGLHEWTYGRFEIRAAEALIGGHDHPRTETLAADRVLLEGLPELHVLRAEGSGPVLG